MLRQEDDCDMAAEDGCARDVALAFAVVVVLLTIAWIW